VLILQLLLVLFIRYIGSFNLSKENANFNHLLYM
jgi:hypothetical protein